MIDSAAKIKTCFQQASDQRAKFILAMPEDLTSISGLTASLVDFNQEHITLELSSLNQVNPAWKNQDITCFFRLSNPKNPQKNVFLNFKTRIVGLELDKLSMVRMRVDYPDKLEVGQRRASLRVDMNPQLLLGFSAWEEDRFVRSSTEGNKKGLFPPKISIEEFRLNILRIIDISAGGLKLNFKSTEYRKFGLNWNKGHSIIIWMVLLEPKNMKKEQFWLKARIKFKFDDPADSSIDFGMEFTHYAHISPDKKMKWLRVKGNIIEQLSNWTFQRHLEYHRQGIV